MNSGRIKIFAAKKAENAHSLVGILKQYNINAEVVSRNGAHEIHVPEPSSEAAKVIINKNIKKPGEKALNIPKASFVEQHRVTVTIVGLLSFLTLGKAAYHPVWLHLDNSSTLPQYI